MRVKYYVYQKQVSHRFLDIGLIFNAHIICLIVTVGYKPSVAGPERSSKNALNLGCKYNVRLL